MADPVGLASKCVGDAPTLMVPITAWVLELIAVTMPLFADDT
jgi:hypothetical protein